MTAVEQFFKDLCDLGFIEYPDNAIVQNRFNLALEMEKEQIMDAINSCRKEAFVQELQKRIEGWLSGDSLTTTFTTCKDAPSFGWSVEEYMYMPIVADRLRKKGYSVSSSVNLGVTDWRIAV